MFLSVLLAVILSPLALACPPPLNNFAFQANSTHTSFELIEAAYGLPGGFGYNDVVTDLLNNPIKPWPVDYSENSDVFTHTINYCYDNENTRNKVQFYVQAGINTWTKKYVIRCQVRAVTLS
jgi:hypothetical protein